MNYWLQIHMNGIIVPRLDWLFNESHAYAYTYVLRCKHVPLRSVFSFFLFFLYFSSFLFVWNRVSLGNVGWTADHYVDQTGQELMRYFCICLPNVGTKRGHHHVTLSFLNVRSVYWTQVTILTKLAFYPLRYHSNLPTSLSEGHIKITENSYIMAYGW